MASIASSAGKTLAFLKTLNSRNPNPFPSLLLRVHGFSSESSPESSADPDQEPQKPIRPMRGEAEKLDETICYMMAQRPWTTRLQNSIRNLVPNFNQALVLGVLRRARHPDHALRFFRWVEKTGFRHDRDTYLEIISILSRNLMLNHARCILIDDMPKREVDREEDMFIELIQGYGREGIPQEVVKLFQKMPEFGVVRTPRSYDAFFKAILRRGRVMMAKRFFNAMIRDGVAPTLSTYNTLLWGFSLCMKMDTANRFFEDMKMRGIVPDIVTYNMLLNGWVRAKKVDDAEKVFAEMSSTDSGPNSISYNLMIKGYVSADRVDDGLRLFGEMREKGIRATEKTYAALMPGLCDDTDRTGEARKVMDEMVERRMTPKDKSIFLRMISSMCRSQDLDGAMAVHQAMGRFRDVAVDLSHYGVLIEGLCNGKKYDKAVEILDELLGKGMLLNPQSAVIEPSAYNPMIEYLCGNGLTSKAEEFFRLLMKKGIDDKVAFNHLIRGHAKEEKPESAFELLNIMNRRGIASDADAYTLLVESYLKKREPADARTVLDGMIEQGHLPSSSLFRSVMVALFDDGRVQTASRVMKSMIDKGVKENMDVVHKILEALFMRGHVEEALGRINLLLLNSCAPDFDSLVVSLCESSKAIEALKLVDFGLERDCDISFSSFDCLLDVLYSAEKVLPAYSILCKIKAKGGVVDKKGCEALIESLVAGGHTKQADILSRTLAGKNPGCKKGKKIAVDA
ncbi:LOW QUALITY PROTEIN: pentatricopeptide repeat-containing protein At2g37230 [Dioscorea cayenensis subsp. rotundata]|uniref:LOW QUALITY PROTEIN: pentatricopeptide repeat-containing protein At2g37230 n=1 Tax=Dioscorea cayennensis subsp. rotundata TaxID=55577 RepID=A0AB40B7Q4_DIOCR|nr:LOW QUALITY PROTEIN: pentatricopeptide repeat-containing protein At2g37230 [Dioscorea cayenensis subsp. rotundata]